MKKLLLILSVLPLISFGQAGYFDVIQADNPQITHDQYYVVPDHWCYPDDYVGQVFVNCTDSVFNYGSEGYEWTIISGNTNSAFKVSSSGMLQINDSSKIDFGADFTLGIQVADTVGVDRLDTATCYVHVTHEDYSVFIALGVTDGSEDGTRDHPYDNWQDDITATPGYAYYLLRDDTCEAGDYCYIANQTQPTDSIFVAAIGQGALPVWDGGGSTDANGMTIGAWEDNYSDEDDRDKYIYVYDQKVQGYNQSGDNAFRLARFSEHIRIARCEGVDHNDNATFFICLNNDYNASQDIEIMDCYAHDNTNSGHGFKFSAAGVTETNLWAIDCPSNNGISNPLGFGNTCNYFYIRNTSTRGFNVRANRTNYQFGVVAEVQGDAIWVYNSNTENTTNPDTCTVKDIYMRDGTSTNEGVYFENGAGEEGFDSIIFEAIVMDNMPSDGFLSSANYAMQKIYIQRCLFFDTGDQAVNIVNTGVTSFIIRNNIFHNNTGTDIQNSGGSGYIITNNTVVGEIDVSGTTSNTVNNFYATTDDDDGNNIDFADITVADYFVDSASYDFRLLETAVEAIDSASSVGQEKDFLGYSQSGSGWDIGAMEYQQAEEEEPANHIYFKKNHVGIYFKKNASDAYLKKR